MDAAQVAWIMASFDFAELADNLDEALVADRSRMTSHFAKSRALTAIVALESNRLSYYA